jgi:hypothetical protein
LGERQMERLHALENLASTVRGAVIHRHSDDRGGHRV